MKFINYIKRSNGQISGKIFHNNKYIIINNYDKPLFIIINKDTVKAILNKDLSIIKYLYDELTLTISELSALYNMNYSNMNKIIKSQNVLTGMHEGRRNSSYGKRFSYERIKNISNGLKGNIPTIYERTPEIREKVSNSLKEGYATGRIKQDPLLKSAAWKRGCYDNAKMGRGIQGYFFSYKNNTDYYFRSLLELKFLILLEEDNFVEYYTVEPFKILMNNNRYYTPDFLINGYYIVELKIRNHLKYTNDIRFPLEIDSANKYCADNNYRFKIIYDDDIDFNSSSFRSYLKRHPDIINYYQIKFKKEL